MKKGYVLLAFVLLGILGILYAKLPSKFSKQVPIVYDKKYIEQLKVYENPTDFNGDPVKIEKVGRINDPPADLFNYNGVGWDATPGDFATLQLHLTSGRLVEFKNFGGGWLKVGEQVRITQQSGKIKKDTYGITLDMGEGNRILILCGYNWDSSPGLLTLIFVGRDEAELIFNKKVDLLAISETENGYRLLGQLTLGETLEEPGDRTIRYPGQKCELFIEHGKLRFKAFPAFKRNPPLPINYDKQQVERLKTYQQLSYTHRAQIEFEKIGAIDDPPAEVYHAILCDSTSTSGDARLGDFSQLYLHFPSDLLISFENFDGGWVGPTDQIKLPHKPKKVKKHRYGITLDVGGGNRILILTGARYTSDLGLLTLIFVGQDNAEMIFNKKVELLEVQETEKGFRLLGQLPPKEVGQESDGGVIKKSERQCELLIEEGKLTFKEL